MPEDVAIKIRPSRNLLPPDPEWPIQIMKLFWIYSLIVIYSVNGQSQNKIGSLPFDGKFDKTSIATYDIIINNINIIDPVNREIIPHKTIFIQEGKISKIEAHKNNYLNNSDTHIIDGTRKFVIPGFWNMHTHLCWKRGLNKTLFPVLLSYGITGARDMGGDTGILMDFKGKLSENPATGPNLFGPGPLLDGEHPIHPDFSATLTLENYRQVLDSLYEKGVDFLKVYSLLPKDLVKEIAAFSKEKNIAFAGHISEFITPAEAAILGQKSFEHLNRIEDIGNDTLVFNQFIQAVKAHNNWLCPTLIIYKRKIEIALGEDLSHPLDTVIAKSLKNEWMQVKEKREGVALHPDKQQELEIKYNEQQRLVKTLYSNEMPLLIGSDFGGMAFVYPGYGFHEEMQLMQELGFDTYDILKMATYNPAVYFEITDDHGRIEEGKVADLIILNSNPVDDIKNTLDIRAVIKSGEIAVINE